MSGASSISIPKPYALARNSRGSGPIVVPDTLPAEIIRGTIQAAAHDAPAPLVDIAFFDRYQGKGVPDDSVSLSVRLTFQAADRTLTDAEVQQSVDKILTALVQGHGAVVVGAGLHEVVGRAYYMNLNARLQWQSIQLGGQVNYLDPQEAQKAGAQDGFERAWEFWKHRASSK